MGATDVATAGATTARLQDALAIACATYLVLLQTNLALAVRSTVFGVIAVVALALVLRADARAAAALGPAARRVVLAFVAWAAWSAASLAWSRAFAYSAGELKTDVIELGVAAGAILLSLRETVVFRRYVAAVLAAFALLAAASLAAFAPGPWNDKLMHHGVGTWSTHLVIVAPLILLVRAPPRAGFGDGRFATAASIGLVVLLLASARASENRMVWPALLASLAVIGVGSALRWPAPWRESGRSRALAFIVIALLIGAAFVDVLMRKAESTQAPPASIERSVAEDPRLAIWPLVRDRIAERPWIGHGYGKEIVGPELARELDDATLTHAHNAFASVWLQTGLVGLALFVALLAAVAWRFAGYVRSRDDALALAGLAGLAILAGVVVKNLTDDFFVRTNARFLWAIVALLVAFGERRLRETSEAEGDPRTGTGGRLQAGNTGG
jgi:O-antigen ligase